MSIRHISFIAIAGSMTGAAQFAQERQIGPGYHEGFVAYSDMFPTDVNGDGHVDIVSRSNGHGRVHLNEGQGMFTSRRVPLEILSIGTGELEPYDIDQDGYEDFVEIQSNNFSVIMYFHDDPVTMSYDTVLLDGPGLIGLERTAIGDLDMDGFKDLIVSNGTQLKVVHYLGGDDFSSTSAIGMSPSSAYEAISSADLDGDLDDDLIWYDGSIHWSPNNGSGGFPSGNISLGFAAMGSTSENSWVLCFDADGDGDLDVGAGHDDKLSIVKNLGGGAFGSIESFTLSVCGKRAALFDADGDLDMDIALRCAVTLNHMSVTWVENNGSGAFSASHDITGSLWGEDWPAAQVPCVADLDQDGDMDCALGSWSFFNDGTGQFSEMHGYDLDRAAPGPIDLDQDGDLDLLNQAYNVYDVDSNLMTGTLNTDLYFFPMSPTVGLATTMAVVRAGLDFNNDDIGDLVVDDELLNSLAWMAGDGFGHFGSPVQIPVQDIDACTLVFHDFDQNGWLDVGDFCWTDNDISYNTSGTFSAPVSSTAYGSFFAHPDAGADVNSDGLEDVISFYADQTRVFFRTGPDTWSPGPTWYPGESPSWEYEPIFGDMNSDGFPDYIVYDIGALKWYENMNGTGVVGMGTFIDSMHVGYNERRLRVSDVDLDGDNDIIHFYSDDFTSYPAESAIIVYHNNGGIFSSGDTIQHDVGYNIGTMHLFSLSDMDSDGDEDIMIQKNGDTLSGHWILENLTIEGNGIQTHMDMGSTGLEVHPNPTSDRVSVSWNQERFHPDMICLLDAQGRRVRDRTISQGHEVQFSMDDLTPGIYLLELSRTGKTLGAVRVVRR